MIQKAKLTYNKVMSKFQVKKPWDMIIIFALSLLLTIPIFVIVHQNFITFNWYFYIDRIILFLLILLLLIFILKALRRITLISVFLYFILLFYGTVFGGYGFQSAVSYTHLDVYKRQTTCQPWLINIIEQKK